MSLQALIEGVAGHRPQDLPALPGRRNHRRAGVLVPVVDALAPRALLTLRASHLRDHAGEVSFPGGKPEQGDVDLAATALREAHEELGLAEVQILGPLSSVPLYTSDFRLVPFVAFVASSVRVRPDPAEVARVLDVPLLPWLERSIPGVPWDLNGTTWNSPIFQVDDLLVFGGTAHVLLELLQVYARGLGRPGPVVEAGWRWDPVLARPVPVDPAARRA